MVLSSSKNLSLLVSAALLMGCPENMEETTTQGGANGTPMAGGPAGTTDASPGTLGAHDCSAPQFTQDAITDGLTVSGTVDCSDCSEGVTISVLYPPPSADDQTDIAPEDSCITQLQTAAGSFSLLVPAGISKINIQTIDNTDLNVWGLFEVELGEGGADNVNLDVTTKPQGPAITSAGEALPATPSGVGEGTMPEDPNAEAPGEPAPTEPVENP